MNKLLSSYMLIILAAGRSSRMGKPKGLVMFRNQTLLSYQLSSFFKYGGNKAIVVLGHHLEKYHNQLPWTKVAQMEWNSFEKGKVKVVINLNAHQGQFSSLQVGLNAVLKEDCEGIFILPIDVPAPNNNVWENLLKNSSQKFACIPKFEDRGGHPVLLSNVFVKKLIDVPAFNSNARLDLQIRKLEQEKVAEVPVNDPQILSNINTMDHLDKISQG